MSIIKSSRTLGNASGGGSVTVDGITDATDTGRGLLKAEDAAAARAEIAAMGADGDQAINGSLEIDKCLTVNMHGPEDPINYQTLLKAILSDGTVSATASTYNQEPGASFLRFNVLDGYGKLQSIIELQGVDGKSIGSDGSERGGIQVLPGKYLQVNGYFLNHITDTGYAVYSAKDAESARKSIAAMGTDGDQEIGGQLKVGGLLSVLTPDVHGGNVWAPLIETFDADGNPGPCFRISREANSATHLSIATRKYNGNIDDTLRIMGYDPLGTPGNAVGGVMVLGYLYVGTGSYDLSNATDTGYAVYTAQDEKAARAAIGAGTSDLTATTFAQQLLQCEDADAVKALLGL